jgi:hypothetical protein
MPVTPQRARELALALENTTSYPHFDRLAFRTPRRTFATLARSGEDLNFMFDLAQQAQFCKLAPHAIAPVAGGWGRMGATRCDLKLIDARTFTTALEAAHARANAPLPKKPRAAKRAAAAEPARAAKPGKAVKPSRAAKPRKASKSGKAVRKPER